MDHQSHEETAREMQTVYPDRGGSAEQLLPKVYDELKKLAHARLVKLPPGQTLQSTALVHEAYMRIVGEDDPGWNSRGHFFGAAARAMRNILVDRAREKFALKRGGDLQRVTLGAAGGAQGSDFSDADLIALDDALKILEEQNRRRAEIVMLRFFAGQTNEQIASMLGVTVRTVERDWRFAKLELHKHMTGESAPSEN
jgi:RNA polymerase sigma factor (TIGR02999 family)